MSARRLRDRINQDRRDQAFDRAAKEHGGERLNAEKPEPAQCLVSEADYQRYFEESEANVPR
ncbi:MAG TPA: hypothetical protein VEU08_17225 [Vicinamibacterales bacterium]|nr:hypothetical protein [Vicinamibacterales bacterium]